MIPEIPDEAVRALGEAAFGGEWRYLNTEEQIGAVNAARAAWPHLYAAALRHAASRIDRRTAFDPGMRGIEAAAVLRKLADEATP